MFQRGGSIGIYTVFTTCAYSRACTTYLSQFSFWALFGGPMLVSTEIRNLSTWKAGVLLNKDIIAINQDDALLPGFRVRNDNSTGMQLWAKHLSGGDIAVILYNRNDTAAHDISVAWTELGWAATSTVKIYDVRAHVTVGTVTGGSQAKGVVPHGHAMWRLTKTSGEALAELS